MSPQDIAKLRTLLAEAAVQSHAPQWIRLPKVGEACPHFGLTKHGYYKLIAAGKITTTLLKSNPHDTKGTRLIHYASVKAYLDQADATEIIEDQLEEAQA
jgi:hypothetical protein